MRRIIPYIIFYFIAVVVFVLMSFLSYVVMCELFFLSWWEPTWVVNYLSVMIGVLFAVLFVVEEK
jgi:hypothetical protein